MGCYPTRPWGALDHGCFKISATRSRTFPAWSPSRPPVVLARAVASARRPYPDPLTLPDVRPRRRPNRSSRWIAARAAQTLPKHDQNNQKGQNQAQSAARVVTPVPVMRPPGKRAEQHCTSKTMRTVPNITFLSVCECDSRVYFPPPRRADRPCRNPPLSALNCLLVSMG
jgi:hypothetical protein